jgi:hypothetical protein
MWTEPLQAQDGKFVFRPNPHGVTYSIPADSNIGKNIAGRQVGIAVHSVGSDIAPGKNPLADRHSMNGLQGLVQGSKWCSVFTGTMGVEFKLNRPVKVENAAKAAVNKFKSLGGDEFLGSLTGSSRATLKTYYNRKVTSQSVDGAWLQSKLSGSQFAIVNDEANKPILAALDVVYNAIIALKNAFLEQLEPQVQGIEQHVGNVPKGEGFNIDSPIGFIKLVNRGVFSTANFAGRA